MKRHYFVLPLTSIYFAVCLVIWLVSCTKSTNISTPPPPESDAAFVDSTIVTSSQTFTKYTYDENKQLGCILIHIGSVSSADSLFYTFHGADLNTPPITYDYTWNNAGMVENAIEHHFLFYDSQKRIILDSIGNGTTTTNAYVYLYKTTFTYNTNNIVAQHYYYDSASRDQAALVSNDTMFISNGNITASIGYYFGNTPELTININNTLTIYNNPLYQTDLSNSLGPLLTYNQIGDFYSVNYMNPWHASNGFSTTFITDSSKRLVELFDTEDGGGYNGSLLRFVYHP